MRVLTNTGSDRVIDELTKRAERNGALDVTTEGLSVFGYDALASRLPALAGIRLLLGPARSGPEETNVLLGGLADRSLRNCLEMRAIATRLLQATRSTMEVRRSTKAHSSSQLFTRSAAGASSGGVLGAELTTAGLGLAPDLVQRLVLALDANEAQTLEPAWLAAWESARPEMPGPGSLTHALSALIDRNSASLLYHHTLHHLLGKTEIYDEEQIVNRGTGIRESVVWQKLYKFQRDGVIGAIEKLERHGGCILADSVGLGKTFEALAVIKYYELRNQRVLVLCPKRLSQNWNQYNQNNGNVLDADRLRYDVLFHTDLSRERGSNGAIDLERLNWGNYDLVVIDESHNFRNKKTPKKGGETRYDKLLKRVIREGVKTKVLMLSATPVNNRLADLRNQIAFATADRDDALHDSGISSINRTVQVAQAAFNTWLDLDESERTAGSLIENLGFDYFRLLDLLTIARSRKHIEKYYGTAETGTFPSRLPPRNERAPVDHKQQFRSIESIQDDINEVRFAALTPMKYVLDAKKPAYEAKYDQEVGTGKSIFKQSDREESLQRLMRVNLLKRLESSVESFAKTVESQLARIDDLLSRLSSPEAIESEDVGLELLDLDDPALDSLTTGTKVKILIGDLDDKRLRQDLDADRTRLQDLMDQARAIDASRDAKLEKLKSIIEEKVHTPLNAGNRKIIVFTAFADTAEYLFDCISEWAKAKLGLEAGLVTGTDTKSTLATLPAKMLDILNAFSPRSKERPPSKASLGDIDILIATDCISEGQNLQDADTLVNYDIHWNPVRIIQRFGRIDRIGSKNARIQLVNFWPDMELDAYINLEQRVKGRMHLLNVSATGEENIIADEDVMNDLEYRRKQLRKLQDGVPDMEDVSQGLSITDSTLADFRIDLGNFERENPGRLAGLPLGVCAVTEAQPDGLRPGVLFTLRAEAGAREPKDSGYPLAPHYVIHVANDGTVTWPYTQLKLCLEALRRSAATKKAVEVAAWDAHDAVTQAGKDMASIRSKLVAAIAAIRGRDTERAAASLFSPGGTHTDRGASASVDDFEVLGFLVIV